jgi:hypothetical protein
MIPANLPFEIRCNLLALAATSASDHGGPAEAVRDDVFIGERIGMGVTINAVTHSIEVRC